MIALLLALLLAPAQKAPKVELPSPPPASIDGLPIGGIARQALPVKGCAAYLFSTGKTRSLVAMVAADAGTLRIALDGRTIDLARAAQQGAAGYGLSAETEYRAGDVTASLTLTVQTRADLSNGAAVPEAILRIERPGRDGIVMPLAGLIGCATARAG